MYLDKNGNLNSMGKKRLKKYAKETEQELRDLGKYDGPRFYMSRMKLLECAFDEVNLTSRILHIPSYVMFEDTETGRQFQVRDSSITEYIPVNSEPA